ncbi:MAG TPA: glycine/sarcosine/betaine reductase selenoprotein B family protein [Xanthobacteraceae bacterium]|nr:glycine/sarcosine/betaine reductase selenoprotein B family protein [Xanthobacteraceae bacterium]
MVRMTDLPPQTQTSMANLECPVFATTPFVAGPLLAKRRVAVVTSAGLLRRGERPFVSGDTDYRDIPVETPADQILMSHVSVNFDRTGFVRDINVVFPIERLRTMAADGTIGSVAGTHYSFMGATDPRGMEANARAVAGRLKSDSVDAVLLTPV